MSAKQILVVEDERPIREMIAFGLRRAGFEVREAADARSGRAEVANKLPDLLLVDWMLPDTSGLEFTRALKRDRETRELPVILLTARAEEGDKVAGLEGGADDYITKPFSPRELLARINAVLRRTTPVEGTERIDIEGLVLDQSSQRVSSGERTVALGPTEYRMLAFFMTHPERVYTREQLLDRVWGGNVYVEERTIDVHIRRLRKALEEFGYDRLTRLFRELRRSTAAMPDGVIMLDPQGEIVWFNRKAGELLDLSRRADLGLRIDNLVRHPDFVRYLRGGQHSLPLIVRIDSHAERHVAFQLIS